MPSLGSCRRVGFDVHHARVGAVVATDMANVDGHTAEVDLHRVVARLVEGNHVRNVATEVVRFLG